MGAIDERTKIVLLKKTELKLHCYLIFSELFPIHNAAITEPKLQTGMASMKVRFSFAEKLTELKKWIPES